MQEKHPPPRIRGPQIQESDMDGWPNTPGTARIERGRHARTAIQADWIFEPEAGRGRDQAIADIESLEQTQKNQLFRESAGRSFARSALCAPASEAVAIMAKIASAGNTGKSIGMAIMEEAPGEDSNGTYTFTYLSRDPDWMGFDPALPRVRGLRAVVEESADMPGSPGTVIALPRGYAGQADGRPEARGQEDSHPEDFPPGQARTLRDLLRWHGAEPVWADRKTRECGPGKG